MKKLLRFLPMIALFACENSFKISKKTADAIGLDAAKICSGGEVGNGVRSNGYYVRCVAFERD